MGPVEVSNLALLEIGNQGTIQSFQDGTPQSTAAAQFYTPKTQMLLRSANWDFCRKTAPLTLLRVAAQLVPTVAPVYQNPPPQPFLFEYAYPVDCLKGRFLVPYCPPVPTQSPPLTTAPNIAPLPYTPDTAIPFVTSTDFDGQGNPIKVILTNLPQAQLVYTADLSQFPDLWDSLFLAGETAMLATYFITALARNSAQLAQQTQIAKGVLDQARVMNANEAISNVDHLPDWIAIRVQSSIPWSLNGQSTTGSWIAGGWEPCTFGGGLTY